MPDTFRAYVVDTVDGKYSGGFRQLTINELPPESVLVNVVYSSLNYKDGLAVTGKGKIAKKFPMVCGIDLAGTVADSTDPAFKAGDAVLVSGRGLSETMWGGYSAMQRINPKYLTRIPRGLTAKQVMAIGTAGFTAMLCALALENAGVTPDHGEVLVTGAAGGVGSIAVAVLAKLGYRVVAATGRAQTHDYLKSLGAADFIARGDLDRASKPLESKRWAAVVDSVGSRTLVTALAQLKDEGVAAACGLAGGADLPANMMPFILRGVKLIGVNCDNISAALRDQAWARLATDLDLAKLDAMTELEPLSNIETLAAQILRGETRGRFVIDVNR